METLSLNTVEQATEWIKSSRNLQYLQNSSKEARFDRNIIQYIYNWDQQYEVYYSFLHFLL